MRTEKSRRHVSTSMLVVQCHDNSISSSSPSLVAAVIGESARLGDFGGEPGVGLAGSVSARPSRLNCCLARVRISLNLRLIIAPVVSPSPVFFFFFFFFKKKTYIRK